MVADKTMVDAFDNKADLQSYIITLMGVVSNAALDSLIVYFYLSCRATLTSRNFLNDDRSFFSTLQHSD